MLEAGRACLILALAICVYGIGASLYGARTGRRQWVASGRRSAYALAGVVVAAFAILEVGFIRSDFSYALVQSHSSSTTPLFYRVTAVWSSQEGSLLLWVLMLSLWSSAILRPAAAARIARGGLGNRLRRRRGAVLPCGPRVAALGEAGELHQPVTCMTVSYTHLTLPTN